MNRTETAIYALGMARQTHDLDLPREVEVLHDGRWLHGWLKAYQRDGDGWRGLVDYRDPETLGHWLHWRGEHELRRVPREAP